MGTGHFLREQDPSIQIIGVQPSEGSAIPGIRRWPPEYLPRIYDPKQINRILEVSQQEAETTARELAAQEGIFVGISSGGACAAALRLTQEIQNAKLVVMTCDRGDRYLSTGIFS